MATRDEARCLVLAVAPDVQMASKLWTNPKTQGTGVPMLARSCVGAGMWVGVQNYGVLFVRLALIGVSVWAFLDSQSMFWPWLCR